MHAKVKSSELHAKVKTEHVSSMLQIRRNVAAPVRGAGVESVRPRSNTQYIKVLVVALMCWLAFLHVRRRPAQIVCRGQRACQGHLPHEAWQVQPLPGVTTGAQLSHDMSKVLTEARSAFERSLNWSAPLAMITAASSATVASSTAPAPAAPLPPQRPVHVLTFADRPTIYLDALAASVMYFNEGAPLHVLGLSNRRTPAHPGPHWNIPRRAISGADPGKLKKLWFVGSLLDARVQLERLGIGETDLLLFVDAFDVFIQRPLRDFGDTFDALVASQLGGDERRRRSTAEAVVLLAEHSCWPWPLPGMARVGRPRGVSMAYMENSTFGVSPWPGLTASTVAAEPLATGAREPAAREPAAREPAAKDLAATEPSEHAADVSEGVPISSDQMCQEVCRRSLGGRHAQVLTTGPLPHRYADALSAGCGSTPIAGSLQGACAQCALLSLACAGLCSEATSRIRPSFTLRCSSIHAPRYSWMPTPASLLPNSLTTQAGGSDPLASTIIGTLTVGRPRYSRRGTRRRPLHCISTAPLAAIASAGASLQCSRTRPPPPPPPPPPLPSQATRPRFRPLCHSTMSMSMMAAGGTSFPTTAAKAPPRARRVSSRARHLLRGDARRGSFRVSAMVSASTLGNVRR